MHDVKEYGAIGNGKNAAEDTRALQDCLDAAAAGKDGSREVCIPFGEAGTYQLTKPLRIRSGVQLIIDPSVELIAPATGERPGITLESGEEKGLIENVVIKGGRFIGGVYLEGIRGLEFSNAYLRNDGFALTLKDAEDFTIRDLFIDQKGERKVNQDGIHVYGPAMYGRIENIRGRAWDDMIALNADDNDGIHGDISFVSVEGVHCENTYNFIRIMSRGSRVDHISLRDIHGNSSVNGGIEISSHTFPDEGNFGVISIENVEITNKGNPGKATFRMKGCFEKLFFSNISRSDSNPNRLFDISGGKINSMILRGMVVDIPEDLFCVQAEINDLIISDSVFKSPKAFMRLGSLCRRLFISSSSISGSERILDLQEGAVLQRMFLSNLYLENCAGESLPEALSETVYSSNVVFNE